MTALLYRTPSGWHLMLAVSDIRGKFRSPLSARQYALAEGFRVKRSPNLDQP